jgi:adenylate cyclase
MAVLKPVGEGDAAARSLDQDTLTIGRDASNAMVLRDMASSSRHARMVKDEDGWRMEDLGSSNGTFVNGWRIETVRLNSGDRIQIGSSEFTFEDGPPTGPVPIARIGESLASSSFLQSFMQADTDAPGELGSSSVQPLLHSLMIDENDDDDKHSLGSNFEVMHVDAGRGQGGDRTVLLDAASDVTSDNKAAGVVRQPGESLAEAKLRLIQRVGEKLVRIFDPNQLIEEIMSIVLQQTGADRGILCLLDEQRNPVPIVARGLGEDEHLRVSRTVLRRLLDERSAVLINQTESTEDAIQSLAEMSVVSTMCVPLWTGEDIIGLMSLDSTTLDKHFCEEDLELLVAVAHQAAMGIERGRMSQLVDAERQMRADLSKYLDHGIVEQITQRGNDENPLEPAEREITVLFSDIVSFTKMSEQLKPAELGKFIRAYLTAMTDIIFAHRGTIDKYIGDAVMALFGAPIASEGSAAAAVSAALEMRDRLTQFRLPGGQAGQLRSRFGINTGLAVVGNLGSERRMEYTALGDTVNVASRLETFARPNEICIDETTYQKTGDQFEVEEIGWVDVKNRVESVAVYKVLRKKP